MSDRENMQKGRLKSLRNLIVPPRLKHQRNPNPLKKNPLKTYLPPRLNPEFPISRYNWNRPLYPNRRHRLRRLLSQNRFTIYARRFELLSYWPRLFFEAVSSGRDRWFLRIVLLGLVYSNLDEIINRKSGIVTFPPWLWVLVCLIPYIMLKLLVEDYRAKYRNA